MEGKGMKDANGKISALDGSAPTSTDYANYFCTYAYLYHQKDMLEDHRRTGAYYQAMMQNKRQFQGKVVLDVGTGSGILSIFAAKAGARKVYAVEATSMAKFARQLVEANKLGGVVEVIQGTIESVELPEKVDIIVSEWMGYFLLRESMLDSVLVARDRHLKPGGALYPSAARLYLAPSRSSSSHQRVSEFQWAAAKWGSLHGQGAMEGWAEFVWEMGQYYDVDLGCLSDAFRSEQKEYYLETSAWADVHPSQLLGPPCLFKTYDLATVTPEEVAAPLQAKVRMPLAGPGPVEAFVGWFDVLFEGSAENPADIQSCLTTAPSTAGATHWGQQLFLLHPGAECPPGGALVGDITVVRKKANHRLMEVTLRHAVAVGNRPPTVAPRVSKYHIE